MVSISQLNAAAVAMALLLASGPLVAKPGVWNVRDFGARADGQHDDLPAILAAIDAAGNAGGGTVLLPGSDRPYLVRGSIKLDRDFIELAGEPGGDGATIKLADGAGRLETAGEMVHVIHIAGAEEQAVRQVRVRDLKIDANYWGQIGEEVQWQDAAKVAGNPRAVRVDHATHVWLENLDIDRPFVGVTFGRGAHHATVEDVRVREFHHDGFGVSPGYVSAGATHITFRRCTVSDSLNGNAGGPSGHRVKGWEIEEGAQHVTLIDCTVRDTSANGFFVRPHAARGDYVTSDIRLVRCRYLNAGPTAEPAAAFFVKGYGHGPVVERVALIDCEAPDDAASIVMAPKDVEVRGGVYGALNVGFYPDVDDPHHVPHGPHGDEFMLLPIMGLKMQDVEVRGEARINAMAGQYKGMPYPSDLFIRNVRADRLLVVGSPEKLDLAEIKASGERTVLSAEQFYEQIQAPLDRSQDPPILAVPWNARSPVIDGKGHDAIYSPSQPLPWCWTSPTKASPINTVWQAVASEEGLAVLLATDDPYTDRFRAEGKADEDRLWQDDNLEFWLQPGDGQALLQWIVNTRGELYDARPENGGPAWNSDARAAASVFKRGYTIELLIPWESVGGRPDTAAQWKANVIHHRSTTGHRWLWSWDADSGRTFAQPAAFGTLTFGGNP